MVSTGSTRSSWIMASLMTVSADSPKPPAPTLVRPSDLPIYDPLPRPEARPSSAEEGPGAVREVLLPPVRAVRRQVQEALQVTDGYRQSVIDAYNDAEARTAWIVKYLREEENKQQRYGAVVMGGLTGFIFGVRGGIIRKLFYATIGTSVMGAICFPEESDNIANEMIANSKHYLDVAYNFCYGVKPGDPQLEVKFPELSFPKDFSEFLEMSGKLASSIKQAVMPPPSKDEQPKAKE